MLKSTYVILIATALLITPALTQADGPVVRLGFERSLTIAVSVVKPVIRARATEKPVLRLDHGVDDSETVLVRARDRSWIRLLVG